MFYFAQFIGPSLLEAPQRALIPICYRSRGWNIFMTDIIEKHIITHRNPTLKTYSFTSFPFQQGQGPNYMHDEAMRS